MGTESVDPESAGGFGEAAGGRVAVAGGLASAGDAGARVAGTTAVGGIGVGGGVGPGALGLVVLCAVGVATSRAAAGAMSSSSPPHARHKRAMRIKEVARTRVAMDQR
jgi:hypothetical protein